MPISNVTSRIPIPTDILFHVERNDGRVDEFRKGDLALYKNSVVTIVDTHDTVHGHIIETSQGGIICLDEVIVISNGKLITVETTKLFHYSSNIL